MEVLARHRPIYENYQKTGEMINLHPHIRQEIVDAYRVEFPHYHYNGSCYVCILEMMATIYKWYDETTH